MAYLLQTAYVTDQRLAIGYWLLPGSTEAILDDGEIQSWSDFRAVPLPCHMTTPALNWDPELSRCGAVLQNEVVTSDFSPHYIEEPH